MDPTEFRTMIDVNLVRTLNGCRAAMEGMAERGGAIWNVLGAGWDGIPVPRMNGYATTKAAVTFLTRALAAEAEGSRVRIGAISPGMVLTEGFMREHAKVPAAECAVRDAVVNLLADDVATVAG
jgi:NADP-dependent 3-hydroxy acid dehydrogenase YdfG